MIAHSLPALRLVLIEMVILTMGTGLGLLTDVGKEGWYETLNRSVLTPPDWTFGVVWTGLYLMIGLSFWRIWEGRAKLIRKGAIFGLFALQMLLNWSWTPIFFTAHEIGLAFAWLLALIIVLFALIWVLFKEDWTPAALLVPYALWCCFAAYLSGTIWYLN